MSGLNKMTRAHLQPPTSAHLRPHPHCNRYIVNTPYREFVGHICEYLEVYNTITRAVGMAQRLLEVATPVFGVCEVWSVKCGMWSVECGVWKFGLLGVLS